MRKIHVGKGQVQSRFQLVLREFVDLMLHGLPGSHGLLRDFEQCLGLQRVVKSLIRGQNNIFCGRERVSVLRLLLEFGRSDKVGGASEVCDELAQTVTPAPACSSRRDAVSEPGADAAAFVGIDCRYGAVESGEFRRPGLAINLMLCQSQANVPR